MTIPRVLALSKVVSISGFIEIGGQRAEHKYLEDAGINVEFFRVERFAAVALSKRLREKSKDVYLVFYAAGIPLWASLFANDEKIVVVGMGSDIRHFNNKVEIIVKRFLWTRVDLLVAKSNNLYFHLTSSVGLKNVTVNYWGIDQRYFLPRTKSESRRNLNLPDTQIILSPRAFSDLYSIDLIVSSFLRFKRYNSGALLLLIGRITYPEYLVKIDNVLKGSGLEPGKDYRIDGEIEYKDIADYFSASDVALSFAKSEGFPTTIFELFCMGCPVIIGDIESLRSEIIHHKKNVLFSEFCEAEISRKIELALSSESLRRDLINMGDSTFLKYGNIDKNASDLIDKVNALPKFKKRNLLLLRLIYIAEVIYNKLNRSKS